LVISAPSGAGKLTILRKVRELEPHLETTVSATTRAPRPGEMDGKDYYFLAADEFQRRLDAGDFVEWAEVHGHHYGTLKQELDRCLDTGHDVILELDVQGMRSLRSLRQELVTVFLMPPSLEELEARLRRRGTDDEEVIALRLRNALDEMAARNEFDYRVVNDDVERAANELRRILQKERQAKRAAAQL